MTWQGAGLSDQGRVRTSNQDAIAVMNDHALWIVADGMGGRAGGDVASRVAVETVVGHLCSHDNLSAGRASEEGRTEPLRRAIELSNHAVREESFRRPSLIGMGTTIVVFAIDGARSEMIIAHVGDSRAYVVREGRLIRLTHDHAFIEEAMREGRLTEKEALAHPLRHVLTRAVGTETEVEPDISVQAVLAGDLILLCTDGLTKMLTDAEILHTLLLERTSAGAACAALVRAANRRGGADNISVVIVRNELTN